MKFLKLYLVLLVSVLTIIAAAAQSVPARKDADLPSLTLGQVEELEWGLQQLGAGSVEQCPMPKEPAKAADAPAARPCPFRMSPALTLAMARNIVALRAANELFEIQKNQMRAEALASGSADPALGETGAKMLQAQREVAFATKLLPIRAQNSGPLALFFIKMSDLDRGDPPEHNRISGAILAALSPIIEDFNAAH